MEISQETCTVYVEMFDFYQFFYLLEYSKLTNSNGMNFPFIGIYWQWIKKREKIRTTLKKSLNGNCGGCGRFTSSFIG